jgi:hypothetical protein
VGAQESKGDSTSLLLVLLPFLAATILALTRSAAELSGTLGIRKEAVRFGTIISSEASHGDSGFSLFSSEDWSLEVAAIETVVLRTDIIAVVKKCWNQ